MTKVDRKNSGFQVIVESIWTPLVRMGRWSLSLAVSKIGLLHQKSVGNPVARPLRLRGSDGSLALV
jgi:hypothetical protein